MQNFLKSHAVPAAVFALLLLNVQITFAQDVQRYQFWTVAGCAGEPVIDTEVSGSFTIPTVAETLYYRVTGLWSIEMCDNTTCHYRYVQAGGTDTCGWTTNDLNSTRFELFRFGDPYQNETSITFFTDFNLGGTSRTVNEVGAEFQNETYRSYFFTGVNNWEYQFDAENTDSAACLFHSAAVGARGYGHTYSYYVPAGLEIGWVQHGCSLPTVPTTTTLAPTTTVNTGTTLPTTTTGLPTRPPTGVTSTTQTPITTTTDLTTSDPTTDPTTTVPTTIDPTETDPTTTVPTTTILTTTGPTTTVTTTTDPTTTGPTTTGPTTTGPTTTGPTTTVTTTTDPTTTTPTTTGPTTTLPPATTLQPTLIPITGLPTRPQPSTISTGLPTRPPSSTVSTPSTNSTTVETSPSSSSTDLTSDSGEPSSTTVASGNARITSNLAEIIIFLAASIYFQI